MSRERLLEEILQLDYSLLMSRQKENFSRYKRFLQENGLQTAFDQYQTPPVCTCNTLVEGGWDDCILPYSHNSIDVRCKIQLANFAMYMHSLGERVENKVYRLADKFNIR